MHSKKEIEFIEFKQRNMTVVEYVAKFEELVKFCPYYNGAALEGSKYIKFENGLHLEIKQGIGYQEAHKFSTLVNKCRIYDEESMALFSHYKSIREKKRKNQYCGKPYSAPADRRRHRASDEKRPSGEETLVVVKCFKCGESSHHANDYNNKVLRCF